MKCKKCNSENLVMRPNAKNPSATELICADCRAWQKFIGKEEIRLFEIRNQRSAPKPSNADRIRSMSDTELAEWICGVHDDDESAGKFINGILIERYDEDFMLDWIQQPAETEGTE